MRFSDGNPVILYKPQSTLQPNICKHLSENDFVLAIQTSLQAYYDDEKLSTNRVICVDGTHGTNGYNFTAITVMNTVRAFLLHGASQKERTSFCYFNSLMNCVLNLVYVRFS